MRRKLLDRTVARYQPCGRLGSNFRNPGITVRRVSDENRGTALSVYTVFADVSFFLVGPAAGAVISAFGYASVFLFALVCVLAALAVAVVLARGTGTAPRL